MRAWAKVGSLALSGALVACAAAPRVEPTSQVRPTATRPAVRSTLASPEDLAAARADAERRVREIDDATRCDFNTPNAERQRRQMEQKQQDAQRELDED